MGNIADYLCSEVRIKKENFGKLEHLLRNMCLDPKQNIHLGRIICKKVLLELGKKDGIETAIETLGMEVHYDEEGNIGNIKVGFEEFDDSYEHIMLPAIAEVVEDGSYLQMVDESANTTQYLFEGGKCIAESGKTVFPSDIVYAVVKHAHGNFGIGAEIQVCGAYTSLHKARERLKAEGARIKDLIERNGEKFGNSNVVYFENINVWTASNKVDGKHFPIVDICIHTTNGRDA